MKLWNKKDWSIRPSINDLTVWLWRILNIQSSTPENRIRIPEPLAFYLAMEVETLQLGTNIRSMRRSLFLSQSSLSPCKAPEIQQSLTLNWSLLPKIRTILKVTQSNNFMKNKQTNPSLLKNKTQSQLKEQPKILQKSKLNVETMLILIKISIKLTLNQSYNPTCLFTVINLSIIRKSSAQQCLQPLFQSHRSTKKLMKRWFDIWIQRNLRLEMKKQSRQTYLCQKMHFNLFHQRTILA